MAEIPDSNAAIPEAGGESNDRRLLPWVVAAGVVSSAGLLATLCIDKDMSGRTGYDRVIEESSTTETPDYLPTSSTIYVDTSTVGETLLVVSTGEPETTEAEALLSSTIPEVVVSFMAETTDIPDTDPTTTLSSTTSRPITLPPTTATEVLTTTIAETTTTSTTIVPTTTTTEAPSTTTTTPTTEVPVIIVPKIIPETTTPTSTTSTTMPVTTPAPTIPRTTTIDTLQVYLNTNYGYDCAAESVVVELDWTLYQMGQGCNPGDPMYLANAAYNTDLACDPNTLLVGQTVNLQPHNSDELVCQQPAQAAEAPSYPQADCPQFYVTFTPGPNWTVDGYLLGQGMPQHRVNLMRERFMSDYTVRLGEEVSLPALSLLYCLYPLEG